MKKHRVGFEFEYCVLPNLLDIKINIPPLFGSAGGYPAAAAARGSAPAAPEEGESEARARGGESTAARQRIALEPRLYALRFVSSSLPFCSVLFLCAHAYSIQCCALLNMTFDLTNMKLVFCTQCARCSSRVRCSRMSAPSVWRQRQRVALAACPTRCSSRCAVRRAAWALDSSWRVRGSSASRVSTPRRARALAPERQAPLPTSCTTSSFDNLHLRVLHRSVCLRTLFQSIQYIRTVVTQQTVFLIYSYAYFAIEGRITCAELLPALQLHELHQKWRAVPSASKRKSWWEFHLSSLLHKCTCNM